MSRLQDKIAVITGGSSGIGLATARRFVEEGAYIFITGRRQSELDKAVKLIGRNVAAVQGDVQSLDDLDRLYAKVGKEKGKIDILVAALSSIRSSKRSRRAISTKRSVSTPAACCSLFRRRFPLIRDGGSIILISSIAAFKGLPAHSTYSASKAAVRSLVRTWTAELKDRGIRVNAISPGAIDTPIIDSQAATKEGADAIRAKFAAATPLNRIGRPEELAAAVLFLASEDSSYVAGADLVVDGGLSAL
jgi:NAD(P)-dependent dehydrogenase (short-subunit alcohol dehydrogenase family)